MDELVQWVPKLVARLQATQVLEDVSSDLILNNPKVQVQIDRERAAALGVTAEQIEQALFTAYGPRQVSTILGATDQYQVIAELMPQFQRDPGALSLLYVRSSNGNLVPLDAVASLKLMTGPLSISHVGQLPAATISFNLAPGKSLSDAVRVVEQAQRELDAPQTLLGRFQGTAQAFEASLAGLGVLLLLAVFTIYLVLGVLYESAIHPLTILSGLPAAGFGALITLLLLGKDLDLFAFLGLILLIGVVKKNAIMIRLFRSLALLTLLMSAVPAHAALKVLATTADWAALARELGGDKVDVYAATTAFQDVHRVDAKPSLVARARSADLVVATGAQLEIGWLPVLLQESGNPRIQVGQPAYFEVTSSVRLQEVPSSVDRSMGDVHPQGNPHVQLDPHNIAAIAKALTARLAQLDSKDAQYFETRGADFQSRWREAIARWEQKAAPLRGVGLVTIHRDQSYLCNWLGLKVMNWRISSRSIAWGGGGSPRMTLLLDTAA